MIAGRMEMISCAKQNPFLSVWKETVFDAKERHKGRLAALPQMPFPGLFHDGPPMARLRKLRAACTCRRQRQPAIPLDPSAKRATRRPLPSP
jgi:hypothetical protein